MAWLYKRGGVWWLGARVNGRQLLRSTGHTDETEAKKILARHEAMDAARRAGSLTEELYRSLSGSTIKPSSFKAEITEWLASCERTTAPRTWQRYRRVVDQFVEFSKATDAAPLLRDVTKSHFEAFLSLLAKSHSAATANLAKKTLAVFFNRAVADGKLAVNPVKGVKPVKVTKGSKVKRRAFTVQELQLLWSKAPNDFWRYMLSGGFYSGLRLGDLICLARSEIDLPNNRLKLEAEKTGREIEIPLAPAFRSVIEKRLAELKNGATYLWPEHVKTYHKYHSGPFSNEFYELLLEPCGLVPRRESKKRKKNGRDAKRTINPVSFHSLRHTFVTQLKASGAHQSVVKELAGHSSDLISDLYTHTPPQLLSEAIARLPEVAV